ncbi:LytR/AlgR family response regulator transcription factor [Pleionea sediminis]|uniref:LytR/AlgR family response regulator transcription factor n=1 Tax=Pleionea sediminis TaxID=2569479 RepID=UPI00118680F4|nr:LytTR family DNA-binding domain-containing protein [Pleionea sediminis]
MTVKRVMIIDDESAARENLRAVIDKFNQLEVIAEVSDGESAIKEIERLKPDLVFLDIEMPNLDGFNVAQKTSYLSYQLVFVTAYEKYALDAFGTNAIDYLLKPVRPELLEKCINKILHHEEIVLEKLQLKNGQNNTLVLTDGNTSRVLNNEDISYIEGIGRYRRVHLTKEGQVNHKIETIISDTTLDEFESLLPSSEFMRVHRSYIINIQLVINIRKDKRRHFATLSDCSEAIPISRSKHPALTSILNSR